MSLCLYVVPRATALVATRTNGSVKCVRKVNTDTRRVPDACGRAGVRVCVCGLEWISIAWWVVCGCRHSSTEHGGGKGHDAQGGRDETTVIQPCDARVA